MFGVIKKKLYYYYYIWLYYIRNGPSTILLHPPPTVHWNLRWRPKIKFSLLLVFICCRICGLWNLEINRLCVNVCVWCTWKFGWSFQVCLTAELQTTLQQVTPPLMKPFGMLGRFQVRFKDGGRAFSDRLNTMCLYYLFYVLLSDVISYFIRI